jgi:hypothetical protein
MNEIACLLETATGSQKCPNEKTYVRITLAVSSDVTKKRIDTPEMRHSQIDYNTCQSIVAAFSAGRLKSGNNLQ